MRPRKDRILSAVDNLVVSFVGYDRRNDEVLPLGEIETAVDSTEIGVDEIVSRFRERLEEQLSHHRARQARQRAREEIT